MRILPRQDVVRHSLLALVVVVPLLLETAASVRVVDAFVVVQQHPAILSSKRMTLGRPLFATAARDHQDDVEEEELDLRSNPVIRSSSVPAMMDDHSSRKRRVGSFFQNLLWPGSLADPTVAFVASERGDDVPRLPPGSLGCPFLGSDGFLSGNTRDGPGCFFRQASERVGHSPIYQFYFFGTPVASVSGGELVRQIEALEFTHKEALSPTYNEGSYNNKNKNSEVATTTITENEPPSVYGNDNMMFERKKEQHAFLRRLVGSGMSATAMKEAFPLLRNIARQRIEQCVLLLNNSSSTATTATTTTIKMEKVCADYTLDVTQKQVLGLELPPDQVSIFRQSLTTWLGGLYSPIANLNIPWIIQHIPEYRARQFLQAKIEGKIDELLLLRRRRHHLDDESEDETTTTTATASKGKNDDSLCSSSVLSNMVFAVDDEQNQKLTRKQIVENALLLIITGSESSAGTLTLMMLLLGLHPDKYQKLVQEQQSVQQKFAPNESELTLNILEDHCPYLNAVMKETLRMGPLTGGFPKRATQTIVVDKDGDGGSYQIPKGWSIFANIRLTHQLDPVARRFNNINNNNKFVNGNGNGNDDHEYAHMDVHKGFHPERWLSEDTAPSFDYMPFGTGPRYCIGAPLATLQIQLFLATLARSVQSFDLATDYRGEKPVVWNPSTIVPRPLDGVPIQNVVPLRRVRATR